MAIFIEFLRDLTSRSYEVEIEYPLDLAVVDLAEEIRGPALIDRLRSFEIFQPFDVVVLRGFSRSTDQISSSDVQLLIDAFGDSCLIASLSFENIPLFVWLSATSPDAAAEAALFVAVQSIDLIARMGLSGSVWSNNSYHFSLPSGRHSDRFVRVGDLLSSSLQIARVADWIAYQIPFECTLVIDSSSILPLALELRMRLLLWGSPEPLQIVELPLYELTHSAALERLLSLNAAEPWSTSSVFSLISVTSSGSYVLRLRELLTSAGVREAGALAVCNAGASAQAECLSHLGAKLFPSNRCDLCDEGSHPIEIDSLRLAPRPVSETIELRTPRARELASIRDLLAVIDVTCAARVHVTNAVTGTHFPIHIDADRLLQSERARNVLVRAAVQACEEDRTVRIIVTESAGSNAALKALKAAGFQNSSVESISRLRSDEAGVVERSGTRIVLVCPIVRSSRTLRAYIEVIQRRNSRLAELDLRAAVLVHLPTSAAAEWGIRSRFYINQKSQFYFGWQLYLPNDRCSWCAEGTLWTHLVGSGNGPAALYAQRRLERLSNSAGLGDQIFMLSERTLYSNENQDEANAATRTTPSAYFGQVGDVATFVGASSVLQRMRVQWETDPRHFHARPAFPFGNLLLIFTDPVITAAFGRAIRRAETAVRRENERILEALSAIANPACHPVCCAEVARAQFEGVIPIIGDSARLVPADSSFGELVEDLFSAIRGRART